MQFLNTTKSEKIPNSEKDLKRKDLNQNQTPKQLIRMDNTCHMFLLNLSLVQAFSHLENGGFYLVSLAEPLI